MTRRSALLSNFLPYRLAALAWRTTHEFAKLYKEEGLARSEWRVLAHLAEEAPLSIGQICEAAMLDKATASRAARHLELMGAVSKRADPDDRRLVQLALTRKGRKLFERILPVALGFEAALTARLSPGERKTLFDLLDRLDLAAEGAAERAAS